MRAFSVPPNQVHVSIVCEKEVDGCYRRVTSTLGQTEVKERFHTKSNLTAPVAEYVLPNSSTLRLHPLTFLRLA